MSQCFVQWRVPILVWYVQIRPFPYQQLQKDILQITTVFRVGSTAVASSSSTEQSAGVFWKVLLGVKFQTYCRITDCLILR
jgi:hypothetical protein